MDKVGIFVKPKYLRISSLCWNLKYQDKMNESRAAF